MRTSTSWLEAHDVMDFGHVDYEIMSLGTVDMEEFEHGMDKEALTDENWIWEEPELIYNPKQMDEHELILARDEDGKLGGFRCFGVVELGSCRGRRRRDLARDALGGHAQGHGRSSLAMGCAGLCFQQG